LRFSLAPRSHGVRVGEIDGHVQRVLDAFEGGELLAVVEGAGPPQRLGQPPEDRASGRGHGVGPLVFEFAQLRVAAEGVAVAGHLAADGGAVAADPPGDRGVGEAAVVHVGDEVAIVCGKVWRGIAVSVRG